MAFRDKLTAPLDRFTDTMLNGFKVTYRHFNALIDDIEAVIPSKGTVKADTISEYTSATGVTVDGVLFKDATISCSSVKLSTAYSTAGTGVTMTEYGDGRNITTTCSFTALSLGTPTASSSTAHGALILTLPANCILINSVICKVGLTVGGVTTDTPDVGLGTTIATGAQSVLSGVGATAEDIITGQTWNKALDGTSDYFATVVSGVTTEGVFLVASAGTGQKIHLNAADGWASGVTGNLTATGYIVINYTLVI